MQTNTFGRLATPQSVTLDAFRVEELLVNPATNLVRVRLSAGVNGNDGTYTPVTTAGTFDLTQEGMGTEVSDTLGALVQQLTDLVQAELNTQSSATNTDTTVATETETLTVGTAQELV